jgi:hypothetical protein
MAWLLFVETLSQSEVCELEQEMNIENRISKGGYES